MPRLVAFATVAVAATALVLFAASCSNKKDNAGADTPTAAATMVETPQANSVTASLAEWSITPDVTSVPAGSVTFNARNIGSEKHELVIIKTDLAEDALPTSADGSVDESQVDVVDEVSELAAGTNGSVTVDLQPGNYVLICNVVDTMADGSQHVHYQEGMRTPFVVSATS